MRVTSLGHASLLVDDLEQAVLIDPVFHAPGERSMDTVPKRVVHQEKFPPVVAVLLSHAHRDHFDVETLKTLPRTLPVYLPDDPMLRVAVEELGFRVVTVQAWQRVPIGPITVVPTPSLAPHLELGFLLQTAQGTVWNQVDTVVDTACCLRVRTTIGSDPDVVFCPFNPILEYALHWVEEVEFPAARYEHLLQMALMARAQVVVPSASGESFNGAASWLNQQIFPVTRPQFVSDLKRLEPRQRVECLNPGEAIVLRQHEVHREPTPFATTLTTPPDITEFRPQFVQVQNDKASTNEREQKTYPRLSHVLQTLLGPKLQQVLDATVLSPLHYLAARRTRLQLDIVGKERTYPWQVQQWNPVQVVEGLIPHPDYVFSYRFSELSDFVDGRKDTIGVQVRRRKEPAVLRAGEVQHLSALEPARLFGVDPLFFVDETFDWHPLQHLRDP